MKQLKPQQFIRSPVFNLYLEGYEYNNYVMGYYHVKIHFNIVKNFPDF